MQSPSAHPTRMNALWLERVKSGLFAHVSVYEEGMRRSVQSVVFWEAKRCVKEDPRCQGLKLFQKRQAFYQIAVALIDSLDFLTSRQKDEILWRTGKSKEPLSDELAWRRVRVIQKHLETLSNEALPFVAPGRSQNDIVDRTVQHMFEQFDQNKGRTAPPTWEYAHNHVVTTFRVYYVGGEPDPNFPAAISPIDPKVTDSRPITSVPGTPARLVPNFKGDDINVEDLLDATAEERRKTLKEVREHLELLKEFEGVIDDEELKKRKRALYEALPPAPPAKEAKKDGILDETEV